MQRFASVRIYKTQNLVGIKFFFVKAEFRKIRLGLYFCTNTNAY